MAQKRVLLKVCLQKSKRDTRSLCQQLSVATGQMWKYWDNKKVITWQETCE